MAIREITPELDRYYKNLGVWGDDTLYQLFEASATRYPNKMATSDARYSRTYEEYLEDVQRCAWFLHKNRVVTGDIVAIQVPNWNELAMVHLACNLLGAVCLPIHSDWREKEVGHLLGMTKARVVFVPRVFRDFTYPEMIKALKPSLPDLEEVVMIDLAGQYTQPIDDQAAFDLVYQECQSRSPNEPTNIMVSSGTTSLPKPSLWSDNNLIALLINQYLPRMKITPKDRAVTLAPASTGATGYVFPILLPLLIGASCSMLERWGGADDALELIEESKATYAVAVPAQMTMLVASEKVQTTNFEHLTRFGNAGAPLPTETAIQIEKLMNCKIHTIYGATDGGVPVATLLDDPDEKRLGTAGVLMQGEEIRLVDEYYEDVPAGGRGEVLIRGANKSFGYLNSPDDNAAVWIGDGWYATGDLGEIDLGNYLRIVGRKKDMIIRGGQNISPREVEEMLIEHAAIADVAIAAMPDKILGERACAFVVLKEGQRFTFDEMIQFLSAQKIAKYKLPERLEIRDTFPTSAGGKTQKGVLTEEITEQLKQEGVV
ncbi:MAG: hypothetical protein DRQ65_04690 [Gammaproteobacteria bacterium]|nr:MAG: hypothetical protein DRQ65_04690 [Gammaproteobacteria bacterium]